MLPSRRFFFLLHKSRALKDCWKLLSLLHLRVHPLCWLYIDLCVSVLVDWSTFCSFALCFLFNTCSLSFQGKFLPWTFNCSLSAKNVVELYVMALRCTGTDTRFSIGFYSCCLVVFSLKFGPSICCLFVFDSDLGSWHDMEGPHLFTILGRFFKYVRVVLMLLCCIEGLNLLDRLKEQAQCLHLLLSV